MIHFHGNAKIILISDASYKKLLFNVGRRPLYRTLIIEISFISMDMHK